MSRPKETQDLEESTFCKLFNEINELVAERESIKEQLLGLKIDIHILELKELSSFDELQKFISTKVEKFKKTSKSLEERLIQTEVEISKKRMEAGL